DRHTGAYIPELAETWEMAPDGKSWTISLRQGVKFHEHWGEFTARDVRHAVFLITQPESIQSDASTWRTLMGIGKTASLEEVARKVAQAVEIVDDYKPMVLVSDKPSNVIGILQTKLRDREGHAARRGRP